GERSRRVGATLKLAPRLARRRHEKTGKTVPLPDESFDAWGTDARCVGGSLNASKAGQSAETDFLVGTGTFCQFFLAQFRLRRSRDLHVRVPLRGARL
ncbi:MAG TPA: hypothetical protein VMV69_28385, partial [Pirellulales bacterium]|nr:hypothetical protein [Pirellulales bacterium]